MINEEEEVVQQGGGDRCLQILMELDSYSEWVEGKNQVSIIPSYEISNIEKMSYLITKILFSFNL